MPFRAEGTVPAQVIVCVEAERLEKADGSTRGADPMARTSALS